MCIGEKRKLTIPPELGYGDSGAGAKIPRNFFFTLFWSLVHLTLLFAAKATLVFEVELLGIESPSD